jgi:biofilm PGA synthesis protein PgaD
MEKPGSRTAARPLIIDRPDLQSTPQRVVSAGLTAFFWAVWAYLWLPVVALLGWAFGISRFYEEMVVEHGGSALLETLGWYALVIALLAGSLVTWATYNLIRFRGKERRSARSSATIDEVAAHAGLEPAALQLWQRARVLRVRHDESGRIESVEAIALAQVEPPPVRVAATAQGERPADTLVAR